MSFKFSAMVLALTILACALPSLPAHAEIDVQPIPVHPLGPDHARPVFAVIGDSEGTELSDFVIPYAILTQSGAADVYALGTRAGAIRMLPAMRIAAQATTDEFDARHPGGADYVVVPAMRDGGIKSRVLPWLRAQAAKGAFIVSICDGALVVANAGLLEGRSATAHWASHEMRERQFPHTRWVQNARYVVDGPMISSAGISASVPLSLTLVEAIAGRDRAAQMAAELAIDDWSANHDSERFRLGFRMVRTALGNRWFSRSQDLGITLTPGIDDVALAFTADAFARTYRSRVFAVGEYPHGVHTRNGLLLLPDRDAAHAPRRLLQVGPPARALERVLAEIGAAYGRNTAALVALQLEFPRQEGKLTVSR